MYSLNHTLLLDSNQCKRIESTVEIVQAVPLNSPVLLAFINIQRIRGSRGTNARRPAGNLINVPRLRSKVARAHTCARPTFKISLFISTISILPILRPPPPPPPPKSPFCRKPLSEERLTRSIQSRGHRRDARDAHDREHL